MDEILEKLCRIRVTNENKDCFVLYLLTFPECYKLYKFILDCKTYFPLTYEQLLNDLELDRSDEHG
jgi:hypothetical protein